MTNDTNTELTEGRWDTIRHEVGEYLRAGAPQTGSFDAEGIVAAVAARANSVEDLPEGEFNAILEANDRG